MAPSTYSRFSTLLSWFLVFGYLSRLAYADVPSSTFTANDLAGGDITVAVNVPSDPKNQNDLYFHFQGPSQATWMAFGLGSGMANALMFVVYPSARGNNVTISPRLGVGHEMPQRYMETSVTVFNGTGVTNDSYTANFMCSGCRSWHGGSVDTTSTAASFIWAVGQGVNVQSDSTSATIQKHIAYGIFTMDLKQATGAGGVPTSVQANSGSKNQMETVDSFGSKVHAFLMCGCFVIGLPLGYLLLRVFEKLWMHWACQSLAAFLIVIGAITGIVISRQIPLYASFNTAHQIIGFVAVLFIFVTWGAGFAGHLHFRKTRLPSLPGRAHRFLGPATISLGLVNGALGFSLAGNHGAVVGYIIVVALMVSFVSFVRVLKKRRQTRKGAMHTAAAENFREGTMEPQYTGVANPYRGPDEDSVPLQHYGRSGGDISQQNIPPPYESGAGYYAPPPNPPPPRM